MRQSRKMAGSISKPGAPRDIDEYIAGFSADVQQLLQRIRAVVKKAAPDAREAIKYGVPTFVLEGNLVHFGAFKKHIGFYPPVKGDRALQEQVAAYAGPKGNLQFPLDAPIPFALIGRIVKLRVTQNLQRASASKTRR